MIIGYARVSTLDQNLDRQICMLNEYGCEKIIQEKFTGTVKDRNGLTTLFDVIRRGDTVVVESISRLGRKTLDILSIIQQLEEIEVQFVSLKENMDTRTPTGKAMLQMMCVIAELERNLIVERVKEGLEASKRRGKKLGRPSLDKEKLEVALRMYESKEYSIKEIVEGTGISQGSLYRAIQKRKLLEEAKTDHIPFFSNSAVSSISLKVDRPSRSNLYTTRDVTFPKLIQQTN